MLKFGYHRLRKEILMKKTLKKLLSLVLVVVTIFSISTFMPATALAANQTTNYKNYTQPSGPDFAYWNGKRMVKHKGTYKSNVQWMQASLNYCIKYKGLRASYLDVDGSFGPASKKTTLAFQKKYGLKQDGSFGPGTISKMKSVLKSSGNSNTKDTITKAAKTLSIDWDLIEKTGKQKVSGPCGCYAFAYCRDIIDNSQHYWTQYSEGYLSSKGRYSYSFVAAKAGYKKQTSSNNSTVYKAIYDNINSGKPVVVNVKGGRSSGCHYIAVVGYTNVSSTSNLSASNFLIIDSAGGRYTTENFGNLGYSLRYSGRNTTYYVR